MNASHANAYLERLGLTRSPFPPTPDAQSYFHTAALERDLAEAAHCLLARKGFVLLTGEVGMGKSTFLRRLLDTVQDEGAIASLVFNTFLQGPALLAAICRDFGIAPGADASADLDALNRFLLQCRHDDRTCVLVIDDAQNLDVASLELLRLLSNLESDQEKLLQIVLAGQTELDETLAGHGIRQLTSRIVKHIRMAPLDSGDCARYVEFRLAQAGAAGRIRIDAAAHLALHRRSGGNPRRVHLIMDRCLYGVLARGTLQIDRALVRAAAAEAGFLPARRMHRHWPLAAAALLAATGLATAAGLAWHQPAIPAVATTATTSTPSPAPAGAALAATLHRSAPDAWTICLQRLAPNNDSNHALQVIPLPRRYLGMLAGRSDLCLQRRRSDWLLAWQPHWPTEQLLPGQRSEPVRELQAALLAHGAFANPAEQPIDGLFGPHTRAALARFQQRHGLPASGRADPLTLLLLTTPAAAATQTHMEPPHGRG